MGSKECLLLGQGLLHRNLIDDVLLSSVLDTDVAQTKWHLLVHEHLLGIDTTVHDINLSDNTDCTDTFGVDVTRHHKTVGGRHIGVGWQHGQDDGTWVGHISVGHCFCDLFDVLRLVTDWNTSNTGQINESQIGACVREDLKHNGFVDDVLLCTAHLIRETNDVVSDFTEFGEFLSWNLVGEHSVRLNSFVHVVQTHLEWTSSDDTVTTGQEVQTHDGLEDRGLTCRLTTQHCDSWQVDVLLEAAISQFILEEVEGRLGLLTTTLINFLSMLYMSSGPSFPSSTICVLY